MRRYRPRCAAKLILLTCSPPGLVKLPDKTRVAALVPSRPEPRSPHLCCSGR